jgi:peptidoglycan hydrolase-like protein with peptidoglycan-binding domain
LWRFLKHRPTGGVLTAATQETIMYYKVILTAAAIGMVSVPAVAEQINQNGQPQAGQAAQPQSRPVPASPHIRAGQPVSPQLLNSHQVRAIQQALEARRAGTVRVDGEWGPDVEAALRNFQKSENLISQNGELDALTLAALGLDPLHYGLSANETTGQALRDGTAQQDRAQDAPEHPGNPGGEHDR